VKKPEDGSPVGVWGLGAKPVEAGSETSEVLATPTPPSELPADSLLPGQVNRNQLDTTVKVAGQVTSFRASWSDRAPNILTLSGGKGSLDVVFWREVEQGLGDRMAAVTRLGNYVRAEGTLSEFRNNLQLRVEDAGNLEVLADVSRPSGMKETAMEAAAVKPALASPTPPEPLVPNLKVLKPSEITKADLGRVVVVSGQVQSVRPSTSERAPTRVYLTDGSANLAVVYWADLAEKFSGEFAPEVGQSWKVYGTVSEYREELQIRAIAPVAP
jgi:DNA/RNA endonuclease YhcR with UshA esterase domain